VFLKVENRRTNGAWAMRPGMYAQARFARGTVNDAIAVPDDTVVREGNEQVVYTVEDGTARFPVEGKGDTAGGFLSRLKRGWWRLAPRHGGADAQIYEQKPAKTARRVVVTTGLREGEALQLREGDVSAASLLIVNVSDDIRDGAVVHIVKGGQ
jgi:multidrug efflux pump subunit AcrA (membrane-fusion protein)